MQIVVHLRIITGEKTPKCSEPGIRDALTKQLTDAVNFWATRGPIMHYQYVTASHFTFC